MMNKNNIIWISWERHRRSQTLCKKMRVKIFEIESKYHFILLKYIYLLFKTVSILLCEKFKYIFVMNPSIILSLFMIYYGKIFNKITIVDAHNIGIFFEHHIKYIQRVGQLLNDYIIKNANLILVTNDVLAKYVEKKDGDSFVLPDPLPMFDEYQHISLKGKSNIFYICRYASDEPFENVIKSAFHLEADTYIYISGKLKKEINSIEIPANVILTDYLSDDDFIKYLVSSDLIVDLTLRDNCLLCGAYEAIEAEKPVVLSKTKALQHYFKGAAVFSNNEPIDIAKTIKYALDNKFSLSKKVVQFKQKNNVYINEQIRKLEDHLTSH